MKVEKRDGRIVEFDKSKIENALKKSGVTSEKDLLRLLRIIGVKLGDRDVVTVSDIQKEVETTLMQEGYYDIARDYISYRYLHDIAREKYTKLTQTIKEKIFASNVENSNANMDEKSFGGRKGEMANAILKEFALNNCMSKMARDNHINNEIYQHDLDSYSLGLHNCFVRDTKFLTDEGIKSFSQFSDGDCVKVLASDGKWRDAVVHYYGRKPMQEITFYRAGKEITFGCTSDHRWILHDNKITTDIRVGDRLFCLENSTNFMVSDKRSAEMFCLGFVIGDGCDHGEYIQARLCGNKLKYISIFKQANYRFSEIRGTSDIVCIKNKLFGKQTFLTTYGWRLLSLEDKIALFNGYMSADGNDANRKTRIVWTSDERVLQMIKEISALAGFHIHKIREKHGDTNYKKDRILYEVTFTVQYENNTTWVVKSIKKKRHKDYEAWCVEEPITRSFTLDGGVVTGNCLSIPIDKLFKNGFTTRQVDIRPTQSINTAFQLLAVIFQVQSLSQFGGVSVTHLDWSMVPYVRKSFYKHYKTGKKYLCNEDFNLDNVEDVSILDGVYKRDEKAYKYAYDMTIKELNQAVEGMYHNLNSLQSRSGNQLPFSSVNYGTCTLEEGRLVIKSLLEASIKGVGRLHKTSVFPCGIFQCMRGVNRKEGDPNYDLFKLALKSTAKRLYPNYCNVDWSVNEGYDKNDPSTYNSTMGKCKCSPCKTYMNQLLTGCVA